MYTELIIGLGLMVILTTLATLLPATLGPKADPLTTPEIIKPEWFFYVAFRWLKLFSATFAIVSTGFIVFIMFAWPWIDDLIRRKTRFADASIWIGIFGALTLIILTLWEALVAH
jgi:quinol-cytochrome oxidoreductase complex cytochrome b subunit